jgi:hypothetical protein
MSNPLLAKITLPGQTFKLPSQGLFYTDELDPDVVDGELEVLPMTARDEILLSTPDKLLSGKAAVEVFARCVPQVLKPMNLLAKDVDFLMICLRLVTFGPTVEVEYTHDCAKAKKHTYVMDIPKLMAGTKLMDPTILMKEYSTVLPNNQKVLFRPMSYQSMLKLYETTVMRKSDASGEDYQEDMENMIADMLTGVIKSVDDISDTPLIKEWALSIPLGWKRQLEQTINSVSDWGIEFEQTDTCADCKKPITLRTTANPISFFFQQ